MSFKLINLLMWWKLAGGTTAEGPKNICAAAGATIRTQLKIALSDTYVTAYTVTGLRDAHTRSRVLQETIYDVCDQIADQWNINEC